MAAILCGLVSEDELMAVFQFTALRPSTFPAALLFYKLRKEKRLFPEKNRGLRGNSVMIPFSIFFSPAFHAMLASVA